MTWVATARPEDDPCVDPLFYEGIGWSASADLVAEYEVRAKLSFAQARRYTKKALARRFGASYEHGYAKRIKCKKRVSAVKVKCNKVRWVIGDGFYYGQSKIWLKEKRGELRWNYAYRIKRLDEFCAIDNPRSQCTKTYVVR